MKKCNIDDVSLNRIDMIIIMYIYKSYVGYNKINRGALHGATGFGGGEAFIECTYI